MTASLLQTLSIGPLNIPAFFIPIVLAWLIYQPLIKRFYRGREKQLPKADSILFNSLLIFIAVWKLSPAVFQFPTVVKNPLAVLYLPGGTAGVLLGITSALVFAVVSVIKQGEKRAVLIKHLGLNAAVLAVLFSVLSLGTGLIVSGMTMQSEPPAIAAGEKAPDFELEGADGQLYRLSDFTGKTVVLNFWASWCPPCRAELPELKSFYQNTDPETTVMLAVNLYTSEKEPAELPGFIKGEGLVFPVLFDKAGLAASVYEIQSIPTTVVVDRDGNISAVKRGAVTEAWLLRMIKNNL